MATKVKAPRKAQSAKLSHPKTVSSPSAAKRKATPKGYAARKAGKTNIIGFKDAHNAGLNRLSSRLATVSMKNPHAIDAVIRKTQSPAVELASTFRQQFAGSPAHARMLAESYARSIKNPLNHRELFQEAAEMSAEERRTLISGYRRAGQARGVVHAVGQLPRGQGRVLMSELVLHENGKIDHDGLRSVLHWLRDAGAEMRRMEKGKPAPRHDTDAAVVDFFEDVADDIANAINSVVDAVKQAAGSLGQAIADMVNWAANDIANLVFALINTASQTILQLLNAALETGYELVRKIVAGLDAIGKGLFTVLDSAFNLAMDGLVTVLKAIDNLGHTLTELLGYLANKTFDIIKRGAEALLAIGKTIGNLLQQAFAFSLTLVSDMVHALIDLGKTVADIFTSLITRAGDLFDAVVNSLLSLGRTLASVFNDVINAGLDLVKEIARAAARAGQALLDFTKYMVNAAADVIRKVLDGLLEAGRLFVDVITTLATHALNAIKSVVNAFLQLGHTLLDLLKETLNLAMNLLKEVVKAAFALGKTIIEFTRQMIEFTYRTAARLIDAALQVGAKVVDILESVAKSSYFIFRKIVNAVLQALGPVGDILGWLLARGEALASALWREAVLAIRFVKKSVVEVLDWAAAQTEQMLERMVQLCEEVGAAVTEVIDWAIARGNQALEILGGLWDRVGNAVIFALNYLESDFIPGIEKFVKGALAAGFELAKFVAWTVGKAFEVTLAVVQGVLEAGGTLAQLVVEIVKHPDQAIQNLVKAARQLGQTVNQVVDAFKQAGDEFADEFTRAMFAIGEDIKDMLLAVLEVVVGWLDTVVFQLMNLLNGFRHLTAAELADVKLVFDTSVDFDVAYIATDSPTNRIIFGIQDFFTGNPDSRAFTTGNLINFDAGDGPIERFTMVHEMTHVWQNQNVGPIYLAHAIADHVTMGDDPSYNYGYNVSAASTQITIPDARYDGSSEQVPDGPTIGEGGRTVMENTAADHFMDFGPEQQGQIMMHYFARRVLLAKPQSDYAPWEKFALYVQSHPQVA